MDRWRENGFVPDSDEEEEFDSQNTGVYEELQNEQGGLQLTQEDVQNSNGQGLEVAVGSKAETETDHKNEGREPEDTQCSPPQPPASKASDEDHANGVEDLEDDPLQDADRLKVQRPRREQHDILETTPAKPGRPSNELEPTSSPDELHFAEHIAPHDPTTPIRRPSDSAPNAHIVGNSALSSPLSSPPSRIQSPRSFHATSQDARADNILDEGPQDALAVNPYDLPPSTSHGRALRPRNAAQINPFLIDKARYLKFCRDHNFRPERYHFSRQLSPRRANETQEVEDEEFQDENVPPSSSPHELQDLSQSPPRVTDPRANRQTSNLYHSVVAPRTSQGHRDKPGSLGSGKHPQTGKGTYAGHKRRKLAHPGTTLLENESTHPIRTPLRPLDHANAAGHTLADDTSIFDVPISPPPSGSPVISEADKDHTTFRFPRGYSPHPVPTPDTERRPNRNVSKGGDAIMVNSSSPPEVDQIIPQQNNEAQAVSGLSEDESSDMRQIRRRIKGVLPASWLRFDLQEQETRENAQQEAERSRQKRVERQSGKGVAQKISGRPRNRQPRRTEFLSNDASDSDSENDNRPSGSVQSPILDSIEFNHPRNLDEDDDIPEDNRIDFSYPPLTRQGAKKPKHSSTKRNGNISSRPRPLRQPRITDDYKRRTKPRQQKPKPPRLGILDAPDVRGKSNRDQPQFLRVAARRARARRNQGRSSPTKKFLRLGTRRDTEDANLTLREWRQGTLSRSENHQAPRSRPNKSDHFVREENFVPLTGQTDDKVSSGLSAGGQAGERTNGQPISAPVVQFDLTQEPGTETSRQNQANLKKPKRWAVRQGYQLSSLRRNAPRPADLDYTAISSTAPQAASSFQQSLSALNVSYKSTKSSSRQNYNLPLARFLSHGTEARQTPQPAEITPIESNRDPRQLEKGQSRNRRPRKRQPQHVNAEALEYRQPQLLQLDDEEQGQSSLNVDIVDVPNVPALNNLRSLETIYSVDFDTTPLQIGTYFHDSTFIGSGEFSRCLNLSARDMNVRSNQSTIHCNGQTYYWDYWNEVVSSQAETLFNTILDTVDTGSNVLDIYLEFIRYVNVNLSFIDPIDRCAFVDKCLRLLSNLAEASGFQVGLDNDTSKDGEHRMRIQVFNLVFANQVRQIAAHELVGKTKELEIINLMTTFATRVLHGILSDTGIRNIRRALEDNKLRDHREAGIKADYPFVEAYLVTYRILYWTPLKGQLKEDQLSKVMLDLSSPSDLDDGSHLENLWSGLFSVLPLQELDELGILHPGLRFRQSADQWQVVKRLISKPFNSYNVSQVSRSALLNNYLRTLFHRCFHLIAGWGWRHCKPILGTLFDFFASNRLHNLDNDRSNGSPAFLDELDKSTLIEVDSRDSCFHIFLKIVAIGFRLMQEVYEKKDVRNLAWRLLPNHGRSYPKEQPLHQEDLDALRNHHDLLCTLYGFAPADCRPRLELIRSLVHPATSHSSACSLHIHAWLRLAKCKISTSEDGFELGEFANWHCDFLVEILKQHSLARTELEAQSTSASIFVRQAMEDAINENQRQVESLVTSALVCMKAAIDAARNMDQALALVARLPLQRLFEIFNARSRRLGLVICRALDVIMAYTAIDSRSYDPEPHAAVDSSEDSQDYGDWTGLEEIYDEQMKDMLPGVSHINDVLHPAVAQFVSRCFGEEPFPEDSVLLKAIDCWASAALVLVRHRLRNWSSYLNPYDTNSWQSLVSTYQSRRFLPHFLSMIIEKDSSAYQESQSQLLISWFASLVDRGSMLQYQHQLTNSILNEDATNPLFHNLPFAVNRQSGRYEISLDEICQRRVSLISSLLSNMREQLESERLGPKSSPDLGNQYAGMIKALMTAMKDNYKELGEVDEAIRGSYIGFVHQIVESLQQHSRGICTLDDFFTDPTSFPLPTSDPTYVVGKLKGYGVRLSNRKTATELVVFVQSVSERAAMDNQQSYLIDQLYSAMAHTFEDETYQQPTLRTFLIRCIFPAYVENAFVYQGSWLLVLPVLRAIARVFADIILDLDSTNPKNVSCIVSTIQAYFAAVDHSLELFILHPGLLEEYPFLLTLASVMDTLVASLAVIDYLDRISDETTPLLAYIEHFRQFAMFAVSSLHDPSQALAPDSSEDLMARYYSRPCSYHGRPSPPAYFAETRAFATSEFQSWCQKTLSSHNGKIFVHRGHQLKEIQVRHLAESVEEARGAFEHSAEIFFSSMQLLETFES